MAEKTEFNDSNYIRTTIEGIFTLRQLDLRFATAYDLFVDGRPLGEIDKKSNGRWWAFRFVDIEEPLIIDGKYHNGKLEETFQTRKEAVEALWKIP